MRIGAIINFLLLAIFSITLFVFSIFVLVDGRKMEKEYETLKESIKNEQAYYEKYLIELDITAYEKKMLAIQFKNDIYVYITFVCYASPDNPNLEPETVEWIIKNNERCKEKWVPENTIRPEVVEVFKKWSDFKNPIDRRLKELNSKFYSSLVTEWKLDVLFVNQLTFISFLGLVISAAYYYIIQHRKKHPGRPPNSKRKL